MWLFELFFFLKSANLICRDTDISKYFRESLGLRDNESRLYFISRCIIIIIIIIIIITIIIIIIILIKITDQIVSVLREQYMTVTQY